MEAGGLPRRPGVVRPRNEGAAIQFSDCSRATRCRLVSWGIVEGPMRAALIFFHCRANAGYAIASYERAFREMAERLTPGRVHVAFTNTFDPEAHEPDELAQLGRFVRERGIDFAFGVDQPVSRPLYRTMREAGVRTFVSYWGAPMSSLNRGPKLLAKRLQVALSRHGPDHYIFESEAMRRTATQGRGIPERRTSVAYLGIDVEVFTPERRTDLSALGIPVARKVVFFSGHVGERRKGCDVLVRAAMRLAETRDDFHFLLCGNKPGEEAWLLDVLGDHPARRHVTFGGYRSDLPDVMPTCYVGAIASTGWDSFTVSGLEMQASGLPVLVSDLGGLPEAIEDGVTGYTFGVGDDDALAARLAQLLDAPTRREAMSKAARERVLARFTRAHQVDTLVRTCRAMAQARSP